MEKIAQLWAGELPLEQAFWNWAVGGGIIVNILSSAGFIFLMMNDQIVPAILVGYGLSLPYNGLVTVGVWRAADRFEGDRRQAEFARLVTVIAMVILSVT